MPPSICLLTAYASNYSAFAALSIPHMKAYAACHEYDFRAIQTDDCDRAGGWIKIDSIRSALSADYEFVFWMDVDALVVRKDIDIRTAVRPGADIHMTWHGRGPPQFGDPAHFNAGIMLIRCSQWSRRFFRRVWDAGPLPHKWNDQAAILHLLGYDDILHLGPSRPREPGRKCIATLDAAWNSIIGIEVADDPIIHHYAGIADYQVRLGLMKVDEATIERRAKGSAEFRRAFLRQLGEWRHASVRVKLHRDTSSQGLT